MVNALVIFRTSKTLIIKRPPKMVILVIFFAFLGLELAFFLRRSEALCCGLFYKVLVFKWFELI